MDKAHPLSTPMVVRLLEMNKDLFRPPEEDEELLGPEVPYLSAIGALMYLANATSPDIAFSLKLLARYSSSHTQRHLNRIIHILRYLKRTLDMGLFYSNKGSADLVGYVDVSYLSDPHKARSQTGYVFTCGDNLSEEDYPFSTLLKFIYKQLMQAGCKQLMQTTYKQLKKSLAAAS
ncbi:secreted RxLR effector protein 161-like [Nicotiana tomentosiformis]|uniref:secreted RxLR effector protein 161-like n=1 Tax=Nicotiana tomentosiformis TaxID=4098 RepID=UPI00388CD7E6